jgi:DNA-binding LytR/AlgR family response regulator
MEKKTISVAVCDDDPDVRLRLMTWIPTVPVPDHCTVRLTGFSSGDELLDGYRADEKFDIVFLDMIMPGSNGIQTAAMIRERDENAIIIYLTTTPEFALQSYRVNAFDYLLKTGDTDHLAKVFDKAIALVATKETKRIQIRSGTTTHLVLCSNIEYIEIYSKKLSCHLIPEQILETYKPIREFEAEIEGLPQFFKIHRSIIINLAYITQLDPKFVRTLTSDRLPIARGKYHELEHAFLSFSAQRN